MRRGLVHTAAWTLATGASVTLSWFGVHTVLAGTAYDPPRALPLSDSAPPGPAGTDDGATPRASSTHRPKPSGSASARPGKPGKPAEPPKSAGGGPGGGGNAAGPGRHPSPGGTSPATSGSVQSYATAGGRVVLDMGTASAQLVSATPDAGWQMQVWKQETWIRVDFTGGAGHVSVICAWNGHAPVVQTDSHAT
ncbi:hypothetical protein [Streptomyces sp. NPDC017529]|uniref:hypothetical protein n=1 Tax=Streptomyces sp. NPDC017529 TaxID=3365000 RepID=UPI0037BDBF59